MATSSPAFLFVSPEDTETCTNFGPRTTGENAAEDNARQALGSASTWRGKHMTQQQREGGTPMDATAMRVDRDIKVTMRDGVRISLCVYRPQAEGRVPALFAASPYQHEFDSVPAFPLFLWRETGPIEWYVAQGYAYVHADVRGSGRSEGEFGFMDATEQEDYVELIAWI